ncbi:hypothetical protein BH24DEI2_BH24DEI2_03890 [soil metagenome]
MLETHQTVYPEPRAAPYKRSVGGFSLVEMMVTLAIFGILLGIAALNLRPLSNDAQNGATILAGSFKQARARAMVTTSAYRLVYMGPTTLRAEYANTCGATAWTPDPRFDVALEGGVTMTGENVKPGDVLVCFSSRGLANDSLTIRLTDKQDRSRTVEVYVGGAVAIQ